MLLVLRKIRREMCNYTRRIKKCARISKFLTSFLRTKKYTLANINEINIKLNFFANDCEKVSSFFARFVHSVSRPFA